MDKLSGGCLCGAVTFEIENDFRLFQLCHCEQCQKLSGSAHASNLFAKPEKITWLSGTEKIKRHDVEGRHISNAFCEECGCRVPFLSLNGKIVFVPAGSLNDAPDMKPQANIFWPERAAWYDDGVAAQHYSKYIE
jgi:hypothetical protein